MKDDNLRRKVESLFALADVRVAGGRPWDIQVHDDRFFARVLASGSLGLGEAYMDGWWDCESLDEFFSKILAARLDTRARIPTLFWNSLKAKLFNLQTPSRAHRSGQFHYDIGNDLYCRMLDKLLIYSPGYWENASSLDEAQENKLESVCRKLRLQPGMRVLDIGCGWGGTARFVAERFQVQVVGVTVAKEQAKFGKELCHDLPVEIRLEDYRHLDGTFDRILSLGMFEHVGYKNYKTFMRIVRKCLKEDGLFLLHTIGTNRSVTTTDPWIARYIFPNGMLPSPSQIAAAIEGTFAIEKWEESGPDYEKTLLQWFRNFHESWDSIKDKYGERFYRMWKYYLLACAGAFRARENRSWEIILSPEHVPSR